MNIILNNLRNKTDIDIESISHEEAINQIVAFEACVGGAEGPFDTFSYVIRNYSILLFLHPIGFALKVTIPNII